MKSIHLTSEEITQILAGEKNMCRKVVKPQPERSFAFCKNIMEYVDNYGIIKCKRSPYNFGEIIYCAEPWKEKGEDYVEGNMIYINNPAITMPEKYSRCKIRITDIKCERLQDMSNDDADKEGLLWGDYKSKNWDSHNKIKWESNPWVWCYTFEEVK